MIQPTSDRATVIELTNEVNGERGRYEVQCPTQQTDLLAFKRKGEAAYTRTDLFAPLQTSLEKLPKDYEQQLLKLCPAKPPPHPKQADKESFGTELLSVIL